MIDEIVTVIRMRRGGGKENGMVRVMKCVWIMNCDKEIRK